MISADLEEPAYEATWYFRFDGGCVAWEFDAEGEEVGTVHDDVEAAVGFYPLYALRREASNNGYLIE
jgi:hypothetical protein